MTNCRLSQTNFGGNAAIGQEAIAALGVGRPETRRRRTADARQRQERLHAEEQSVARPIDFAGVPFDKPRRVFAHASPHRQDCRSAEGAMRVIAATCGAIAANAARRAGRGSPAVAACEIDRQARSPAAAFRRRSTRTERGCRSRFSRNHRAASQTSANATSATIAVPRQGRHIRSPCMTCV